MSGTLYGGISMIKVDFPSTLIHRLKITARISAVTVPRKYITTIVNPCASMIPKNRTGGIKAPIISA
jgi:hypothetical protein